MAKSTPIAELRERLQSARDRRDEETAREIELELVSRETMGASAIEPIMRRTRAIERNLLALMATDPERKEVSAALKEANRDLASAFGSSLTQSVARAIGHQSETTMAMLDRPMRRRSTNLAIDAYGRIKPEPARNVPNIANEAASREDILSHASGLLTLSGDRTIEDQQPLLWTLLGRPEDVSQRLVRTTLPGFSTWREAFPKIAIPVRSATSALLASDDVPRTIRQVLGLREGSPNRRDRFGQPNSPVVGTAGAARRLQNALRHETLRAYGQQRDIVRDQRLPGDVLIGYVLHSVFDEDTAPDHAARDGWRFFRDNRAGSSLPWRLRIIPPYRINCLCFTVDLYETPAGEVYTLDWHAVPRLRGARVVQPQDIGGTIWDAEEGGFVTVTPDMVGETMGRSDAPELEPRDVNTWSEWFDQQTANTQRKLVGPTRWNAADGRRRGKPRYRDFVHRNGRMMTSAEIDREPQKQRERRLKTMGQAFRREAKRRQQALQEHGNQFVLDANQEEQYRKRLDSYLKRYQRLTGAA